MELEQEIDRKLEEKTQENTPSIKEYLEMVELGKHKFITTKEGANFLNELKKGLDLIDTQKPEDKKDWVKFNVELDFIGGKYYIPYETTKEGLDHFKHLMDPYKEERKADRDEAIPKLTFHD